MKPPASPPAATSVTSVGAASFVIEAPTLPAPNTPSAKPCRSGGYQTETQAIPTANDTPAKPEEEGEHEQLRVSRCAADEIRRDRGDEQQRGEDESPTEPIGEEAEGHPEERARQDRDRDEQRELPVV